MISVVLCTHNPREDHLKRTLAGLRDQNLDKSQWELIVVDNSSAVPVDSRFPLSWHPNGRVIREEELGLTPARIRGINEGRGDLLVFVDDDNVLDPDFLGHVSDLAKEYPKLGAWGGCLRPEYEEAPHPSLKEFLPALALREFSTDKWSNFSNESEPYGAGMCVRRVVAERYKEVIISSPLRRSLDRRGANLSSAGDVDLAQTAYEVGLGTGGFVRLKLTHLIPRNRVQPEYLFRMMENSAYSGTLLRLAKGTLTLPREEPTLRASWKRRLWSSFVTAVEAPFSPPPTDISATANYRYSKGYARAISDFRKFVLSAKTGDAPPSNVGPLSYE